MSRLIDATELEKKWFGEAWVLEQKSIEYCDTSWEDVYDLFFADLYSMPTVDAEPVRHGHWKEDEARIKDQCSACGVSVNWSQYKTPYCPFCGAKMDEVET